jgi:hypothetical protein
MAKNYMEVRVDGSHTKVETHEVNGHSFEIFIEWLNGSSEWYSGIVGTLPDYLEKDHKKPGLIGRGHNEDECRKAALEFLEQTFPAWTDAQRQRYEREQAKAAEEAAAAEAAKKADAKAAKKAAK